MKVSIIWSCPDIKKPKGLTKKTVEVVLKTLKEIDDVEIVGDKDTMDSSLEGYRGTKHDLNIVCESDNEYCDMRCCLSGEMCSASGFRDYYRNYIEDADKVIIVSPVYFHDTTECMRNLFDKLKRHTHFVEMPISKVSRKEKKFMLVSIAGYSGTGAEECLGNMARYVQQIGGKTAASLSITRQNSEHMLKKDGVLTQMVRHFAKAEGKD